MVLKAEILQLPLAQLAPYLRPMGRAMEIQHQQLGFATLPLTRLARLFKAGCPAMPALPLDLLTQVVFQLQGHPALTTAEAFVHLLQLVGAQCGLGQFAQQLHHP